MGASPASHGLTTGDGTSEISIHDLSSIEPDLEQHDTGHSWDVITTFSFTAQDRTWQRFKISIKFFCCFSLFLFRLAKLETINQLSYVTLLSRLESASKTLQYI